MHLDGRKKTKMIGYSVAETITGEDEMYDVVIIGAGVSGSAIARELSRYTAAAA